MILYMNNTITTKTYWENTNGQVCCNQHIGYSATQTLSAKPASKRIKTDLTVWQKMSETAVAEFTEFVSEFGKTEICESCR